MAPLAVNSAVGQLGKGGEPPTPPVIHFRASQRNVSHRGVRGVSPIKLAGVAK